MASVGGARRRLARGWCALLSVGILVAACEPRPGVEEREPSDVRGARSTLVASDRVGAGVTEVSAPFGVDRPKAVPKPTAAGPSAVAWDGRQFLVVWRDTRAGSGRMFATRVKPDGTVLDPAGLPLNFGTFLDEGSPNVAFDGQQFVVVWLGETGVHGVHVSTEGAVLRRFSFISGDEVTGRPPALACNPALCLVGFSIFGDDGSIIVVSRVTADGTVLEPSHIALSPGGQRLRVDQPSAAWDGTQFLVAWHDSRGGRPTPDIYGARVLPDGTVLDPGGFPISTAPGAQERPSVVWTGRRFLVVWEDSRGGESDIFGARVRPSGKVDEPEGFPISTAPGEQLAPRLAHIGGRSLVVWEDARGGGLEVRGARVKEDATVEDSGFLVSSGAPPNVGLPAVAAGKDRYFVSFAVRPLTFDVGGELLGTRVERDGDVLDRPPRTLTRSANEQRTPAVAASDEEYLVVWRDFREPAAPGLFAARVEPDGTVRDSRGIRLPAGTEATEAAVASDGRDFLTVWTEPVAGSTALRGARVSRSGSLLDAAGLELVTSAGILSTPRVASSGDGYLVVWADSRDGGSIRGVRVTRGGTVLDPGGFRVSPDAFAVDARVTYDGSQFLVVYATVRPEPGSALFSVRAVRVTEGGSVLDTPSLVLSPERPDDFRREFGLAVASDGRDSLVVWSEGATFSEEGLDLRMKRVTREGTVLEPVDAFVASGPPSQDRPTLTFDGRDYLVAWEEQTRFPDIMGARVSREGRVLERIPLSANPGDDFGPSLASVGGGRSVVFSWEFLLTQETMVYRVQGRVLRGP